MEVDLRSLLITTTARVTESIMLVFNSSHCPTISVVTLLILAWCCYTALNPYSVEGHSLVALLDWLLYSHKDQDMLCNLIAWMMHPVCSE